MTKSNEPKTTAVEPNSVAGTKNTTPPRLALVARHDGKGGISVGVEKWSADTLELWPAVSHHKSKGSVDSEVRMTMIAGKGPPLPYFVFDSKTGYAQLMDAATLTQLARSIRSFHGRFERITEEYGAPASREDCVKRLLSRVAVASADP